MSKVFIVTGASKGLGAAIATYLLGHSHRLVLSARSADVLEEMQARWPGQVEYVAGDIARDDIPPRLVDRAVAAFGGVDGVVINHGMLQTKRFDDLTMADVKHAYEVNVFSCLAMAQASLKELRKSKGCIVWTSSGAAAKPYVSWGTYGSSKAAVNSISQILAAEEPDITSVAIAPGRVDTEMQALIRSEGAQSMSKAQHDEFVRAHREGALLKPEQPGHVMARFLCEPNHVLSGKFVSWNSPELAAYQS
ncbi:putative oxidoreductase [Escovopsis weberi]|uniref:Putative oxidoreductase n=1 Tax=Escovopsis weberi TaxID=150374 RepID=A0A0M8MXQ1_ESCWE|nr:putative oxidoreductase [Escovopsis weberi]